MRKYIVTNCVVCGREHRPPHKYDVSKPNIYSQGFVCLTCPTPADEPWAPSHSTPMKGE
jgi:hypothetical protein